jgi:hypothetical protein
MKWVQRVIIFILFLGFPFLQCDQTLDWDWLVCDNLVVIKMDTDSPLDEAFQGGSIKVVPVFSGPPHPISQIENPLSVWHGFFQGTSPFWRPPPN